MMPRSILAGPLGVTRRQYWRKQFTPNSFATEVSNSSTHFRFVATAQLVDVNDYDPSDVKNVDDDRVYYERRIAGFFEIAPDLENENVGALHSMGTAGTTTGADTYGATGYITKSGQYDSGEWYANGMPAYWRSKLNFEGRRMVAEAMGWDADKADMPNRDLEDWMEDPRFRYGEAPLGQHDRWYDYRGWDPSYYPNGGASGTAQTAKRIQFLHFVDNNLK